ncbi:MAG: hypothetical protein IKL87_07860 [Oscillospiraceae bacterium]|nr:hypothetical protein [Oscillospiraceae bacterium]
MARRYPVRIRILPVLIAGDAAWKMAEYGVGFRENSCEFIVSARIGGIIRKNMQVLADYRHRDRSILCVCGRGRAA